MNRLRLCGPGLALLGVFLCLLAGCRRPATAPADDPADPGPEWFADVTAKVGLDFVHDPGPTGRYFMPQIMGSGCAFLDFDNDGRLDILLIQNGGPDSSSRNRLYRQLPDGTFKDVSAGSGLDVAGWGMGVAVGDFDNDGWVDVYVSEYGGGRLFRNRGDGTFEDVTRAAGVANPKWGTSCCFVDYDRDGWLDLVVVNYVDYDPSRKCGSAHGDVDYCHPDQFGGAATRLFHNRGKGPDGRWLGFEDVTAASGLARRPGPGLGVACADFTGDGWPDLFVANDAKPNHLWVNNRDGTFSEEGIARGAALNTLGNAQSNMGVALGDADGKGRLDLFVTHLTEESHTLWKQAAPGLFEDRTAAAGLTATRYRGTGFGTIFADFDHDGWIDLAVANGRVSRSFTPTDAGLGAYWNPYAERNQLFANTGGGKFRDISRANPAFCGTPHVHRGLAWGDVDGDGAIDLLVTTVGGPARLFRNVAPKQGHWLMVRAVDPRLKRDAYGAVVTVKAGERRWLGVINPGQSYLSSSDPCAHFGLGPAERVDEVRVDWPDGLTEVFPAAGVDRVLRLQRGEGREVKP
jgi:hypothetical protein